MTDQAKLEIMTGEFTKLLLKYRFSDLSVYTELVGRLAVLVNEEIKYLSESDRNREFMSYWGALNN